MGDLPGHHWDNEYEHLSGKATNAIITEENETDNEYVQIYVRVHEDNIDPSHPYYLLPCRCPLNFQIFAIVYVYDTFCDMVVILRCIQTEYYDHHKHL